MTYLTISKRGGHNKLNSDDVLQSIFDNDTNQYLDKQQTTNKFHYKGANHPAILEDRDFGEFLVWPRRNKYYSHPKRKPNYQQKPEEAFEWLMSNAKCTKYIDKDKSEKLFDYVSILTRVTLFDIEHGEFEVRPVDFRKGVQHPSRHKYGIDLRKPTYLYLLTIMDGKQYKIGITNNKPKDRYKVWEREFITDIKFVRYQKGIDAHNIEQEIVEIFKNYLIDKSEMILSSGFTETFKGLNIINKLSTNERFKTLFKRKE